MQHARAGAELVAGTHTDWTFRCGLRTQHAHAGRGGSITSRAGVTATCAADRASKTQSRILNLVGTDFLRRRLSHIPAAHMSPGGGAACKLCMGRQKSPYCAKQVKTSWPWHGKHQTHCPASRKSVYACIWYRCSPVIHGDKAVHIQGVEDGTRANLSSRRSWF